MAKCQEFLSDHLDEGTVCDDPAHMLALHKRWTARSGQWSPIVRGRDGGGVRDFLDEQPIHCGSTLELQTIEYNGDDYGEWTVHAQKGTRVRYEMAWGPNDTRVAVLHVDVGGHEFKGPVEQWMRFRWPERS